MSRRPWLVVLLCVALLLLGLPSAGRAHQRHAAIGAPEPAAERARSDADVATTPADRPVPPHDATSSPLALAVGALVLLAHAVGGRRRLALALVVVIAILGFEGAFHAALHLRHVSHPNDLTIGASAAAPAGLSPDVEVPAAPTPVLLGPAPEGRGGLGAGIGHASHRGRAPPVPSA